MCVFRSCRCVLRRRTLWITWLVCCRIPSWRYGWRYAAIFPEPRSFWHTSSTRSSHRAATRRRPKSLHQLPRYPKNTRRSQNWHKHNRTFAVISESSLQTLRVSCVRQTPSAGSRRCRLRAARRLRCCSISGFCWTAGSWISWSRWSSAGRCCSRDAHSSWRSGSRERRCAITIRFSQLLLIY